MKLETHPKRIFGLDLLRAIAIILVVLGHGKFILNDTFLAGFPYFNLIDGVDIFFVLSGFLIGGILLRDISEKKQFKSSDLLRFWKRRWFRTLPNYYLILGANYLVVKHVLIKGDLEKFDFHFFTFTQNFNSPLYGFFWESWSLSVEEWFYLLTPILIFGLYRMFSIKISFLAVTIAMIFFSLLYRYRISGPNFDSFWWDVTFRKIVLCRLDSIGFGLLVAWIYFYYPKFWDKIKVPSFILGIALTLFLINYDQGVKSLYKQTIYFSILPFTVMLFLPLAEGFKKANGIVPIAIQHVSKISYSMYLINLALVAEVIKHNFQPSGGFDGIIKYLIYWVIVIVVSTLLFKYFEKPMMELRDLDIKSLFQKKSE